MRSESEVRSTYNLLCKMKEWDYTENLEEIRLVLEWVLDDSSVETMKKEGDE